jgi:energy-coupling factor transporter ATP-binding protein EcfA2
MTNAIKYNVSAETLALKKGNFWIGTGDVGKGPTNVTGYYNGITPPAGGFTIYLNKETSGPSIYTVSTEAQLVSLTNTIGAQSFTTSGQCLNWFATQTDKMIFNRDYEPIVTNGLVLNLDAGFTPSYPTTATTWYDVSSGGNNGTLINGPTYSTSGGGSIVFDGINDYANVSSFINLGFDVPWTIGCWFNTNSTQSSKVGLITLSFFPNLLMFENGMISLWNSVGPSIDFGFSYPYLTSSGSYNNGEWHCVVGSCNTGGIAKLYVDGVLINSANYSPNKIRAIYNGVDLGRERNNGPKLFNGKITFGVVYDRALSDSEVLQNYNAQKGRFGL